MYSVNDIFLDLGPGMSPLRVATMSKIILAFQQREGLTQLAY